LAKEFQGEAEVVARLKELAAAEAAIMRVGESQPRMHS
jgi:tRNA isopentenyl-2-thiomethyl-A-37 hydroxylase MiaE